MNNYDIKIDIYGTKCYYLNNLLHREDGLAIEYPDGDKIWYLNGIMYGNNSTFTNDSWKKFIKILIFS